MSHVIFRTLLCGAIGGASENLGPNASFGPKFGPEAVLNNINNTKDAQH